MFYYSGENLVHGFDPVQSEPKPKKIKKSQDEHSQCEHAATTVRNLKTHVKT